MGTSRKSENIWDSIRSRDWKKLKTQIRCLINKNNDNSSIRSYIMKDSFSIPFNKKIGCKLFGHKWCTKEEIEKYDICYYICWKCNKIEDFELRKSNERDKKLKSIIG